MYFVTGSDGFIGTHLCAALDALGQHVEQLDTGRADIPSIVGQLMEAGPDDIVYLLGANADVSASAGDPTADVRENLEPTVAAMHASARAGQVVFASTFGGFYAGHDPDSPVPETVQPQPTAPYFVGKLAAEHYLRLIRGSQSWMALRLANVYGPRGRGVVADWCSRIARGEPIDIWGPWDATRDYVYIDDVVDAFIRAGHARPQAILHVGTGRLTSLREVAKMLEEITERPIEAVVEEPRAGYAVAGSPASCDHAKELLGWRATMNLKEGLWRTWQSYKP